MTKFASMIYKMIHFIHAVVEKMFLGTPGAFARCCVVSHSPESPPAVLLSCSRPQPTRSIQVRTGWSSRTMSSVGAVLLLWTFSQKVNTKKDVCVRLMQRKHNERFYCFPQITLDGDGSILRASEKTFFPLLHIFCLCDCVRRERCRGTTCPYTKLFYNYIENKFQLKHDLLLLRGLRGKSCAAASLQESFKDD